MWWRKIEKLKIYSITILFLGLIIGTGCGFLINDKLLMTIEVRDNIGLYNISKIPVYNNDKIMNQSANILLGISYIWNKK